MWIEVGHIVDDAKDLEIRAYDTDHDGYLDTWEVFRTGESRPVRVTHVSDPQATPVALDRKIMMTHYNTRVLPDAIAEEEKSRRLAVLMDRQRHIQQQRNDRLLGEEFEILVDARNERRSQWGGRTSSHRLVNFASSAENLLGEYVRVRVTRATPNSFEGEFLSRE